MIRQIVVLSVLVLFLILVGLSILLFTNMKITVKRSLMEQEFLNQWVIGNRHALIKKDSLEHLPTLTPDMVERFRDALRVPTVSRDLNSKDKVTDKDEFEKFIKLLTTSFPKVHANNSDTPVTWQRVNTHSLLYIIPGHDTSLKPALFSAHTDVVPVENQKWTVDPFQSIVKDHTDTEVQPATVDRLHWNQTFIYGRGAIDDKQSVMGLLEALEHVLNTYHTPEKPFHPARTLLIALGHDEEIGGVNGAKHIRLRLEQLGYTELEFLLDEGSMILDNLMNSLHIPVAVVSTSEKGSATINLTLQLTTDKDGAPASHASMPDEDASVVILLAKALLRLHENPLPPHMNTAVDGGMDQLMRTIAPYMPISLRLVFTNMWFFAPFLSMTRAHNPTVRAMSRTTNGFTIIQAGTKSNVLPTVATAVINHRIHPGDSLAVLKAHYHRLLIGDQSWIPKKVRPHLSVQFQPRGEQEPSPESLTDNKAYGLLYAATKFLYPKAVLAPAMLVANTDSRHYLGMVRNVYRFCPTRMEHVDLKRFHGADERISMAAYEKTVQFYYLVITGSNFVEGKRTNKNAQSKEDL